MLALLGSIVATTTAGFSLTVIQVTRIAATAITRQRIRAMGLSMDNELSPSSTASCSAAQIGCGPWRMTWQTIVHYVYPLDTLRTCPYLTMSALQLFSKSEYQEIQCMPDDTRSIR
jgi:hypothetical protein